ncbi:MAG TPA: thioredoxin domain-containing protein [Pyrinomonadaceae bacterium]|jgi:protein-disulfide isomerase
MKRYLPFIIIGAVLLVAIGGGLLLSSSRNAPQSGSESATGLTGLPNAASPSPSDSAASSSSPVAARSPAAGANPPHFRGGEKASVTLEEFGDFQCPPCGLLDPELRKLEAEFGTRLRVIFRNFPLTKMHKNALDAARAAEAAGVQGKYWEMHDMLYDKQNEWSVMPDARPTLAGFAARLGLDVERYTRDMDSRQVETRIINDITRGDSMGVKGTPTLFINGREIPAASMTAAGLRAEINNALNEKR